MCLPKESESCDRAIVLTSVSTVSRIYERGWDCGRDFVISHLAEIQLIYTVIICVPHFRTYKTFWWGTVKYLKIINRGSAYHLAMSRKAPFVYTSR